MAGAYEIPGEDLGTLTAAADRSARQFRFADFDSTGIIDPSDGGAIVGIQQNKPAALAGESITLMCSGVSFLEASEAIAVGNRVTTTSNGRARVADGGDVVHGRALTAVSNAGEYLAFHFENQSAAANPSHSVISIPITLAQITGAGDVVTTWTPGFAGSIVSTAFVVTTVVTTGSKLATLNLEIGTTNVTGGDIALTSANATPLGKVIAGSAVTANNVFTATDTISVEAASVTAFSEGAGVLLITVQG